MKNQFKNIIGYLSNQKLSLIARHTNMYHYITEHIDECTLKLDTGTGFLRFKYGYLDVTVRIGIENYSVSYVHTRVFESDHVYFPVSCCTEEGFFQHSLLIDTQGLDYNDFMVLHKFREAFDATVRQWEDIE
jgi:hypothetical protein